MAGYLMDIKGLSMGSEEYEALKEKEFQTSPCPECGNGYVEISSDITEEGMKHMEGIAIMCPKCGARTKIYDVPWKAILEWNNRYEQARHPVKGKK